jgi:hypothetical protein
MTQPGVVSLREGPGSQLRFYDAAKSSLAEARRIDEVKNIRDKAIAIAAYARQANDTQLLEDAAEIRTRAERRVGEMMAEMAASDQRAGVGRPSKINPRRTNLQAMGINEHLADRARRLSRHSQDDFENDVIPRARERAGRRAPQRGVRLPSAPINVNQLGAMVSSEMLSKVSEMVNSQKVNSMITFSAEMNERSKNTVVMNIDRCIDALNSVKDYFTGRRAPQEINPRRRRVR